MGSLFRAHPEQDSMTARSSALTDEMAMRAMRTKSILGSRRPALWMIMVLFLFGPVDGWIVSVFRVGCVPRAYPSVTTTRMMFYVVMVGTYYID